MTPTSISSDVQPKLRRMSTMDRATNYLKQIGVSIVGITKATLIEGDEPMTQEEMEKDEKIKKERKDCGRHQPETKWIQGDQVHTLFDQVQTIN
jgi:hypothetical protein